MRLTPIVFAAYPAALALALALASPAAGQVPDSAGATLADSAVTPDSLAALSDSAASREPPPSARRLSLEDAEELALANNERVLIAREEIERTAGQVREIRAQSLPSLDVTYTYTRNLQQPVIFFNQNGDIQQIRIGSANDNNVALTLDQKLFSRAVSAASRGAEIARDVSALGLEDVGSSLTLDVRTAYYTVLLNDALITVQEEALRQAERRLRQVEQFFEVGTAAEFDRLTAEVEVDNIRPLLIEARNAYELSLNALKRVTGVALDEEISLTDSLTYERVELTLEQAQAQARVERSDLRRQAASVQLQQEVVAAERAQAFPELSFNLDLTRRASSDEFVPATGNFSQATTAGLELRVPVFDGRAAEGRVRQARAQLNEQELTLSALRQDVELQVQQAYQNVTAGAQRIESARATVGRAQRALKIAQTRFRNGLSTQLELNDAELALTQARTTLARALFDYNVARAQLVRSVGGR